jgi:hypothetical protein
MARGVPLWLNKKYSLFIKMLSGCAGDGGAEGVGMRPRAFVGKMTKRKPLLQFCSMATDGELLQK